MAPPDRDDESGLTSDLSGGTRPALALAFGETSVTLFAEIDAAWEIIGEVALEGPAFDRRIAELRSAGLIVDPSGGPVRLWLPESQVLRHEVGAEGVSGSEAAQAVAEMCGAAPEDVVTAFEPGAEGSPGVLFGAYRSTWEEARGFALAWGFSPGQISAHKSEAVLAPAASQLAVSGVAAWSGDRAAPRGDAVTPPQRAPTRRVASLVAGAAAAALVGALAWSLWDGVHPGDTGIAPRLAQAPLPARMPPTARADLPQVEHDRSRPAAPHEPGQAGRVAPPPGRADALPPAPRPAVGEQPGTSGLVEARPAGADGQPPEVAPLADQLARLSPSSLEATATPEALPGLLGLRGSDLRAAPDAPRTPEIRPFGGLGSPLSPAPRRSPQPQGLRPPALAPTGRHLERAGPPPRAPPPSGAPIRTTASEPVDLTPQLSRVGPQQTRTARAAESHLALNAQQPHIAAVATALGGATSAADAAPGTAPLPNLRARAPAVAATVVAVGLPASGQGTTESVPDDDTGSVNGVEESVAAAMPHPPARPLPAERQTDVTVRRGGAADGAQPVAFKLPPRKPPPPAGINLDRTALIGVLDLSGVRTALVRVPDGGFLKVRRGSKLDGWTVGRIGRDALRLTRGREQHTLVLVHR